MGKTMKKKMSPYEFALNFEVKGSEAYLQLAVEAAHPLGKKLFYSLAKEEIDHAERIDAIYKNLEASPGAPALSARTVSSLQAVLKEFFLENKKEMGTKKSENITGYEIAMKMEKKGYQMYTEFRDAAATQAEREFYTELLKEEKEHLDALVNVYSYLTGTEDWFQEEESRVWNWMNL